MTARTVLTPVNLVQDGAIAQGAGTSIAGLVAAGATITDPPGPFGIVLIVANSDTSAHNLTVRAGGSGLTATGAANPGVAFEEATVGDEVTSVPASTTMLVGPFETARVCQKDGSLSIDFATGFVGTITAVQLPYLGIVGE